MSSAARPIWLLAAVLCAGFGYPQFAEPRLEFGRAVWVGTCSACHANSLADAPQLGDAQAWRERVARGSEALYASALSGRVGADGSEMPARGGNPQLTDVQVRAAVDYMVRVAIEAMKGK